MFHSMPAAAGGWSVEGKVLRTASSGVGCLGSALRKGQRWQVNNFEQTSAA